MSSSNVYPCKGCLRSLPVGQFSKSQINKLEHKKITEVKCIACTEASLPDTEKTTAKTATTAPLKEIAQTSNKGGASAVVKKFDPSMQYIRNPKGAPIIADAIQFAATHNLEYPVRLGPINGWRTVVKMAVRGVVKKDKKGRDTVRTAIGLFKPGSHEVASCADSTAHHPKINQALAAVEAAREAAGVNGYIEGSGHAKADENDALTEVAVKHNCYLKYVILILARATSTVQLSLVWNTEPTGDTAGDAVLQKFTSQLLKQAVDPATSLFHSVWVNYNPSSRYNNAITGRGEDSWKLLHGEKYVREIVRTDMKHPPQLLFPPFVFRQANICAFTHIICNVRHWIKDMISRRKSTGGEAVESGSNGKKRKERAAKPSPDRGIKCVELYAGVGTIGLNCLDLFTELNCSDENPHNLACFEAARAAIEPEEMRARASYRPQNATAVAVSGGLRGFDLVLVDPPRKGFDDEVVQALLEYRTPAKSDKDSVTGKRSKGDGTSGARTEQAEATECRNNERLIYVSCGFPAFKRDAARLLGLAPVSKTAANTSVAASVGAGALVSAGADVVTEERYWKLVHLEGHVLFPGSDHVETLAIFDRL
jgi:tRNA/tmRNA/rRNA uracil-C5-methylase (TrmA/RlmC/RlmD family)